MGKVLRQSSHWTLLFCLFSALSLSPARAQVTATGRQLQRLDLALSGVGVFTKNVQGTNYQGVTVSQNPSSTLGALGTVRYTRSPLLGVEFNYGYARYTENFLSTPSYITGGAQTTATEASFGYVAHGPQLLGFHTFGSAGIGAMIFKPTAGGGQGLPERARFAPYYAIGVEEPVFTNHIGLRAQFRQVFFTAPDFDQNYLTLNKRTFTTEPGIGIYVHF